MYGTYLAAVPVTQPANQHTEYDMTKIRKI